MLKVPSRRTKALLDLAGFIEKLKPEQYDQTHFRDGDARCLCGWSNKRAGCVESDLTSATRRLHLTDQEAKRLFSGAGGQSMKPSSALEWWIGGKVTSPTPKQAAQCLRHLAVTGDLPEDW